MGDTGGKWQAIKAEIREILIEMARAGRTITYSELCLHIKSARLHYHSPIIVSLLTDLGREEEAAGRPMLPALVVTKQTGMPGAGFFKSDSGAEIANPVEYWAGEVQRVYDYWSQH